jgi:hypothetical protein
MGSYRVYYRKLPTFMVDAELTYTRLYGPEYVKVREVEANNLEALFIKMQGEEWSPHGEAREHILSLGLHHTSMSVGDVAVEDDGKAWQCDILGWREVAGEPPKRHKKRMEVILH